MARRRRVHRRPRCECPPRRTARAVHHRHPATERHRRAPHGARAQQHGAGCDRPLAAYGGRRDALGPRHRPRRHRHAERHREAARARRAEPLRRRPRGVRRAHQGVRRRHRLRHPQAARGDRLLVRLDAYGVHALAGAVARRARGVRAPLGARPHLQGAPRDPLVPAVHDVALRRGGRVPRRAGAALPHQLPAARRSDEAPNGCHHAPRDDARRRGRGRQPRRRALPRPDRPVRAAADRAHPDPGGRRRVHRPDVRHRRGEDHSRARRERLRSRAASRTAAAGDHDRRRGDGRSVGRRRPRARWNPRPRPRRGARAHRRAVRRRRPTREGRGAPACR